EPAAHALHHAGHLSCHGAAEGARRRRRRQSGRCTRGGTRGRPPAGGRMNISYPFIRRPVGTTLLAIGLFLTGVVAYRFLPVASVPAADFPTIRVSAGRPGADPVTMAATTPAPLEPRLPPTPPPPQIPPPPPPRPT